MSKVCSMAIHSIDVSNLGKHHSIVNANGRYDRGIDSTRVEFS